MMKKEMPRILYLCAFAQNGTMSYFQDFVDAFARAGAHVVNLGVGGLASQAGRLVRVPLARFDHVVFGYSFYYGVTQGLVPALEAWLKLLRKKRNVFMLQNEYRFIRGKLDMARRLGASHVTTQLYPPNVVAYYSRFTKARILAMPHALNEKVFTPDVAPADRPLDIGNRSALYPPYLGDQTRQQFLLAFGERARQRGFVTDIEVSNDPSKRFNREGWVRFLNSCRYTVATEAGTGILEYDDRTRLAVNAYTEAHPGMTFEELEERFFSKIEHPISGKCISSRHFDAIGTKTCQILLEGRYNDILVPGEHYIEVRADLSNLDEVLDSLLDETRRREIVERAYKHVMAHHTLDRRVSDLLAALEEGGVIPACKISS